MNPGHVTKEAKARHGFSLLELLAAIITAVIMAGLLIPTLRPRRVNSSRINCVSNLKQIGLGLRMWANDQQDRFPWEVPASEGGTLEYAKQGGVLFHFQAISNELTTPRVLFCRVDTSRTRATAFSPLPSGASVQLLTNAGTQISYFVGLDAKESQSASILTGDRNLAGGALSSNGILTLVRGDRLNFTRELHNNQGNIGLADGSAQQLTSVMLNRQLEAALKLQTNEPLKLRLVLPR